MCMHVCVCRSIGQCVCVCDGCAAACVCVFIYTFIHLTLVTKLSYSSRGQEGVYEMGDGVWGYMMLWCVLSTSFTVG